MQFTKEGYRIQGMKELLNLSKNITHQFLQDNEDGRKL